MRRAVFLDKDGTLVEDVPYNVDPARMRLHAGVGEGLRALHAAGFALVVISNQAGVAHGYFPEAALWTVATRLVELCGVPLAGFYWCPHDPRGSVERHARACDCRKPAPGLPRRAAHELGLDLDASWFVGDILNDVEAGRRAGCQTILIDNGGETEWRFAPQRRPHYCVKNFAAATAVILNDEHRRALDRRPHTRADSPTARATWTTRR